MSQEVLKLYVPELDEDVEVLIDRWGIPHIYAQNQNDLFIAQGFNAARDRLWQIDFWRRRTLGKLSEVFGASYYERDRAARLFLYRGDMRTEWLSYGVYTRRIAQCFVTGVNAYIKLSQQDERFLPVEFRALGYAPELWQVDDIARMRSHGVFSNLREEVARARTMAAFGETVERLRRQLQPAHAIHIPEGFDPSCIPEDVLQVYDWATTTIPPLGEAYPFEDTEGSNNWVLSPHKTNTGRAMLANDPHRLACNIPGLRYICHLSAPGLDVIGAGEPGLPGVSIGHNGQIAFGLTTFPIDQEDLYVYQLNPDNAQEYWYEGGWQRMEKVSEQIDIKGEGSKVAELFYTRHGPVIYVDAAQQLAFAVRAAWLEQGMAPYLVSTESMRAKNWYEFSTTLDRWGAPPLNHVYADTEGNIGWKAAGLMPKRPNWDGTLPVTGDGRYEWDGFYEGDALPYAYNPAAGYIATANELNVPADHPLYDKVTYDWFAPYRKQRLDNYFMNNDSLSLSDSLALQNDVMSWPAKLLIERLQKLGVEAKSSAYSKLLFEWDYRLHPDSASAALFELWYRKHFRPALKAAVLKGQGFEGQALQAALQATQVDEDFLADARVDIEILQGWPRDKDSVEALQQIVELTLSKAVKELQDMLGTDLGQWRWGDLHQSYMYHPMSALLAQARVDSSLLALGPYERGGSGDTVCDTAYDQQWRQISGATFRIVVDVGQWDNSRVMNAPGQSGNLDSPFYSNLAKPWAQGDSIPLLYSRAAVEKNTAVKIVLSKTQ